MISTALTLWAGRRLAAYLYERLKLMLNWHTRIAIAVALAASVPISADVASADEPSGANPSKSRFEGHTIDLSEGWGDAAACAEFGDVVDCYRTEDELLDVHPDLVSEAAMADGAGPQALASSCSTTLRLYRDTGFSGSVLHLSTLGVVHNLSSYGFDNDTSSYKVGACSASFYSGANAGGSVYPGSTSANSSASSMLSGWNNVVSSVYIN